MKRCFDILISSIALLLLTPLFLVISLAIYFDDPGPIFFSQVRVGKNRQGFLIFKFRSMVVDASQRGGYATETGDPRITRLGQFIRRSSLDELPQLLNVLIGDMSLVGPRPDVFEQKIIYTEDEWMLRHRVRPGITGLSQATLRSQATLEERKFLDLYYVSHPSFWLDLFILFRTVRQVVYTGGN